MNARLSEHTEASNGRAVSGPLLVDDESNDNAPAPVLSVSARDAGPAENTMTVNGTSSAAKTIFLTPRVIDQETFDDLAGALRELIAEADQYRTLLAEQIGDADRGGEQAAKLNASLQERLRLSARMLKAFQSQIVRIETAIADFDQQHQKVVESQQAAEAARDELNAHCEQVIEQTRNRLDQMVQHAAGELEAQLTQRLSGLTDIDARLEQCTTRAASLESVVDVAEKNISSLAYRNAEFSEGFECRRQAVEEIIEQCDRTRTMLSEQLLKATEKVNTLIERCDIVQTTADEQCEKVTALQSTSQQTIDDVNVMLDRLAESDAMRCELDAMLERLQHWEPLLKSSTAADDEPLPEPLAQVVDTVQMRVDTKLASFSSALREMADGIELGVHTASHGPYGEK